MFWGFGTPQLVSCRILRAFVLQSVVRTTSIRNITDATKNESTYYQVLTVLVGYRYGARGVRVPFFVVLLLRVTGLVVLQIVLGST
jgi:hypothetical protein